MDAQSLVTRLRPFLGEGKEAEIYRRVAPLIFIARLDAELALTKVAVLDVVKPRFDGDNPRDVRRAQRASRKAFFNTSPYSLETLLEDDSNLASNLLAYVRAFSPQVSRLLESLDLETMLAKVDTYNMVHALAEIAKALGELHPAEMTRLFDELAVRAIDATGEKAFEAITPRDVVPLVVDLCLAPHRERLGGLTGTVVELYDPAFGTGGMLIWAARALRQLSPDLRIHLLGHDKAPTTSALGHANVLVSDVITSEDPPEILVTANCLGARGHDVPRASYVLCNPPYGESWRDSGGKEGKDPAIVDDRFAWGCPNADDGQMMFLLQGLDRLKRVGAAGASTSRGGRAVFVANGSPLFSGAAASGPSEIRRQLFEHDWLDVIVALPPSMFFNTGIQTYLWVVDVDKPAARRGLVRLVNASAVPDGSASADAWEGVLAQKLRRSRGDKRVEISPEHRARIVELAYSTDPATTDLVKVFPAREFGFLRITVERPQRRRLDLSDRAFALLQTSAAWQSLGRAQAKKDRIDRPAIAREKQRSLLEVLESARSVQPANLRDFLVEVDRRVASWEANPAEGKPNKPSWSASLRSTVIDSLSILDPAAPIFVDVDGAKAPDAERRAYENVPLLYGEQLHPPMPPAESDAERRALIAAYMEREVLPHVPDAWVDHERTKVGYEIPFTRYFYTYEAPRPLAVIENDIRSLRQQIDGMLDALEVDLATAVETPILGLHAVTVSSEETTPQVLAADGDQMALFAGPGASTGPPRMPNDTSGEQGG